MLSLVHEYYESRMKILRRNILHRNILRGNILLRNILLRNILLRNILLRNILLGNISSVSGGGQVDDMDKLLSLVHEYCKQTMKVLHGNILHRNILLRTFLHGNILHGNILHGLWRMSSRKYAQIDPVNEL